MATESPNAEIKRNLLLEDHSRIAGHIRVGMPIFPNETSLVRVEEPTHTLELVLSKGLVIITGPSRIGKTSLANLTQGEFQSRGGNILSIDCDGLSGASDTEKSVLRVVRQQGIVVSSTKELVAQLKRGKYLVAIDELTKVIDPEETCGINVDYLRGFIESLQKQGIPTLLIIHEIPYVWREVAQTWPFLTSSSKNNSTSVNSSRGYENCTIWSLYFSRGISQKT